jgi:LDH2 family malate/lactate/ureidoglycolate dehydrogenase
MLAEPVAAGLPGRRFSELDLLEVATTVLAAVGASAEIAGQVARSLVMANMLGHDSHGILRLAQYARGVESGRIKPAETPRLASSRGATAVVDGRWGFGQPAAALATDVAIERASAAGVAAVTIVSCNHIGRLGEYVATIAGAGKIGIVCCNSGPAVAPFGGARRVMGTNPLAWAAPLAGGDVVLDFATSTLAEGKVRLALADGRSVPPGSVLDPAGRPSTEPADFYDGGALVAFGGHKGSGLSMLIELSAGLLSGMRSSPDAEYGGGNGTLVLALDIAAFLPLETYHRQAEEFCRLARTIGDGQEEVLLPGEVERRALAERRSSGVRVQDSIRRELTSLADTLGVDLGDFALR